DSASSRNASPSPARARESRSAVTILRSLLPHHVVPPPGIYTAHGANWAARGRPVSRCRGVCTTDRPDDLPTGSCRSSWKRPWRLTMESSAADRSKRMSRTLARVFAGWRTGLSGPVIVLQAGTAVNYFGTGLVLPFEIIYLHQARGFPTATAGVVLAAIMGTAAVVTPLSGALLDRFRAKPILITGNLASALGYAGFAFVDRPWQAFVCAAVGGAGFGLASTANQVLTLTLVSAEHRASSIALRRVAGNVGLGSGATVAGFIVAFAHALRAFQALYLLDGVTFAVFALVVLVGIPNP